MIEGTVVNWLSGQTAAGTRVSVGSRLQSGTLPAIVVEMPAGEAASLGATPLGRYDLVLNCIADTMLAAQSLADAAEARILSVASGGSSCAVTTQYGVLEEPVVGEGDEAEPAICTVRMEIFYKA